ncbi:MAG: branched-chain amino acid ABC transporter permease [Gammaproteobacteria bacterium]
MVRYPALVAVLVLVFLFGGNYLITTLIVIALHAMAALGLSLLMGYTGQISLGHAAFYGTGAYGSALIALHIGASPWIAMVAAAAIVGTIGWGLGWLIFRLRGHHLAMATLGFGVIVHVALVELHGLTGGPNGLTGIPPFRLLGKDLFLDKDIFPLAWAACLVALVVCENLIRSPLGLRMRAVGANERAAASIGLDPGATKRWVLALSAVLAALAGSIYGHYIGYLSPNPFSVVFSIKLLLMVAVGGFANIWGVLFGVAFITIAGEILRPLGYYDVIVFGALLVAVMIFFPQGLLHGCGELAMRLRERVTKKPA